MFGQALLVKTVTGIVKEIIDNRELKKIRSLEKRIKVLEKNSHPPAEFICECGCKAKRKTTKRRK
tara:strand:+ start:1041 stop:1235 length:195 start_codon:yes stop_codon:yes gene_type:complete